MENVAFENIPDHENQFEKYDTFNKDYLPNSDLSKSSDSIEIKEDKNTHEINMGSRKSIIRN